MVTDAEYLAELWEHPRRWFASAMVPGISALTEKIGCQDIAANRMFHMKSSMGDFDERAEQWALGFELQTIGSAESGLLIRLDCEERRIGQLANLLVNDLIDASHARNEE